MITPKRVEFARAYVLSGNATESAVQAGFSPRTARQAGSRLSSFVDVKTAIETERARLRAKADLRAEDVIAGLREIAEDVSAPHAAIVSAWKALGNHLGFVSSGNPVAEGVTALLTYLADGGKPAVEAEVRHIELPTSSESHAHFVALPKFTGH